MDLAQLQKLDPLDKIASKSSNLTIRYVTFNVNGVKTLFNYYPWTQFNQDYDLLFSSLQADIITLQELKLSSSNISSVKNIGHLPHYKSFISIPKVKRGYSGVGLFVRIPREEESSAVRRNLQVIKAEEGITGYLSSGLSGDVCYRDLPESESIGGYPDDLDSVMGLELDSEGRCVCIELACNLVVFALYCPANSMGEDEGEAFRLNFLKNLLKRCYNLKYKHGKEVIVMGDINVSLDLIDSAEGIDDRQKQRLVLPKTDGIDFETINYDECFNFKRSTRARALLNQYTIQSLQHNLSLDRHPDYEQQFLYDTTRYLQGRRMQMYTVWNTLNSSRAINFGSRIDLILASSYRMIKNISNADIWPFILGSDHCPVFTDFEALEIDKPEESKSAKLHFEAKYHHKLSQVRDISLLFSRKRTSTSENNSQNSSQNSASDETEVKRTKPEASSTKSAFKYVSRKPKKVDGTKPISTFFTLNSTKKSL
ncbi:AP endonuclease [Scheffersomyces stipitis CBS 6054]|uniref:AP endonuclease n=1 Tax=Scheffersomyces stipitis (strain ATCC 58785 / CBS 6054 / NBRC 10063 / NRRL Y-11545) TaxID=322104 RepID=A3GFP4_PICST|nr:AP endonuclease [Scheffersomyces stipitis CBS 6054]EAZ63791.2 AP endonuclease [Scheffersomyces stipitis CBS 6054]